MAFASRCGLDIELDSLLSGHKNAAELTTQLQALFNEELGAVVQVRPHALDYFFEVIAENGLTQCVHRVAKVRQSMRIRVSGNDEVLMQKPLTYWLRLWSETSYRMQALRDNPMCAQQEYDQLLGEKDPGLSPRIDFARKAPMINRQKPAKVAILREQGVNGQLEMAAAFDRAGFEAIDVHMSDLLSKRTTLDQFNGLVACGGFSFGDVLGAGRGWAKMVLMSQLADDFERFFHNTSRFALGVCNGCQMLSQLAPLIPGAQAWPRFTRNQSEQFEARLSVVTIKESPSIWLQSMAGSRLLIASSHGEGRAEFSDQTNLQLALDQNVCMQYVDNFGAPTQQFPANPNGSHQGITALTNADGRIMVMMPHPERVFRQVLHSWAPAQWQHDDGPWMQMFYNAKHWSQQC